MWKYENYSIKEMKWRIITILFYFTFPFINYKHCNIVTILSVRGRLILSTCTALSAGRLVCSMYSDDNSAALLRLRSLMVPAPGSWQLVMVAVWPCGLLVAASEYRPGTTHCSRVVTRLPTRVTCHGTRGRCGHPLPRDTDQNICCGSQYSDQSSHRGAGRTPIIMEIK